VPDGQLANVMAAAFPFLVRLGSGGFASGYSSGLRQDDGKYGVVKVAGRAVGECGGAPSDWRAVRLRG
jgi:hypothetical protein